MNNKILLIVESPNKVETLKQFLPKEYVIMASVGHISEIDNTSSSYFNTGIYPSKKFRTNYVVSKDKKEVVAKLKKQVEMCSKVVIASDPDREGEAIAWSLKKFLNIPEDKYERVTFHEITKNAVLTALKNPRKIDDSLVLAAQTRQKLDKIFGYRVSSAMRKIIHSNSAGRCKSPTLILAVEREKEIQAFKAETYYDIFANIMKDNKKFKAKYVGTASEDIKNIKDSNVAQQIVARCTKNKDNFVITNVDRKNKLSYAKPPFTTSSFQQEVSSKLGIGIKKAQAYAQKLFEGINVNGKHIALITYIRTDSTDLAPEFLPKLEKYVKDNYGKDYYSPIREVKKGENVQDGHEAIRPVDLDMTPELLESYISDVNLLKVYKIIYQRTVATMMKPQVVGETTYTIMNDNDRFNLVSKEQIFDGYKKVYNYKDETKDEEDEVVKVSFELNEHPNVFLVESIEKHTNPPSRYNESTMEKKLESLGIARPSTLVPTVTSLYEDGNNYCELEDKYIVPTEKGIKTAEFLKENFTELVDTSYTSEMEKSLDLIANNKMKDLDFLTDFYNKVDSLSQQAEKASTTVKKEYKVEYSDEKCPNCGAKMIVRINSKDGTKFLGCSKYPKCKGIKAYVDNH